MTDNTDLSPKEWAFLREKLGLSDRQMDICKSIFAGAGDKEIAGKLRIALPTVRTHVTRIFAKVGVGDRFKLAAVMFHYLRERCATCPKRLS